MLAYAFRENRASYSSNILLPSHGINAHDAHIQDIEQPISVLRLSEHLN